eukprot:TRINITY_DN6453_c0_g1_i1.p1 TRINITY_DN6453_c0_g1~~TRINITY_DN6453_c0_g1_i1.p1  ORF type:complete len:248 (+),score=48.16 TRINITY_DN6453_c0_g1_i1:146-889(+)
MSFRLRSSSLSQLFRPGFSCGRRVGVARHSTSSPTDRDIDGFSIQADAITEEEEAQLLADFNTPLARRPYQNDHFDGVICGFREVERSLDMIPSLSKDILRKVMEFLPQDRKFMQRVHVIDLAKDGYITDHVDSVKFCGDYVAGLSLGSKAVMRFTPDHEGDGNRSEVMSGGSGTAKHNSTTTKATRTPSDDCTLDVVLPRRSLYVMSGASRYEWRHAILSEDTTVDGTLVSRSRRVSCIFRDEVET